MAALYFGGSFNPVHHGHLISARSVAEIKGYARVVLLPTGQPPHKPDSTELASATDRLEMCRLGTTRSTLFAVDEIELNQRGPSYTIETVRQLARRDGVRPHWLIGADMLLYLPQWHQPLELLREVQFVVMARPGWQIDWQKLPREFQELQNKVVQTPQLDIRASDIRRRVGLGLSIQYLTPEPVCQFVQARGLYRAH